MATGKKTEAGSKHHDKGVPAGGAATAREAGAPASPPPAAGAAPSAKFTSADWVVTAFAAFGFLGAIALQLAARPVPPPAIIAFLLACGASALFHRFLGGLQGVEFIYGAIKLVGNIGVLMGVFYVLNGVLVQQQRPAPELSGQWRFQYVEGGWRGALTIDKAAKDGKYPVRSGVVQRVSLECAGATALQDPTNTCGHVLFTVTGGQAWLNEQNQFVFDLAVHDEVNKRDVRWVTAGTPLSVTEHYSGSFLPQDAKGHSDGVPWGISLEKVH